MNIIYSKSYSKDITKKIALVMIFLCLFIIKHTNGVLPIFIKISDRFSTYNSIYYSGVLRGQIFILKALLII